MSDKLLIPIVIIFAIFLTNKRIDALKTVIEIQNEVSVIQSELILHFAGDRSKEISQETKNKLYSIYKNKICD